MCIFTVFHEVIQELNVFIFIIVIVISPSAINCVAKPEFVSLFAMPFHIWTRLNSGLIHSCLVCLAVLHCVLL